MQNLIKCSDMIEFLQELLNVMCSTLLVHLSIRGKFSARDKRKLESTNQGKRMGLENKSRRGSGFVQERISQDSRHGFPTKAVTWIPRYTTPWNRAPKLSSSPAHVHSNMSHLTPIHPKLVAACLSHKPPWMNESFSHPSSVLCRCILMLHGGPSK